MVKACFRHLKTATNGGIIKTTMTVFPPKKKGERGPRIWNLQLLRYACYRMSDLETYGLSLDESGLEMAKDIIRPTGSINERLSGQTWIIFVLN